MKVGGAATGSPAKQIYFCNTRAEEGYSSAAEGKKRIRFSNFLFKRLKTFIKSIKIQLFQASFFFRLFKPAA